MERNGDVLTEFNHCPERFRLNTNYFDLVNSKMCKDDISKSLFCEVPKSLRNNDILSNGFSLQTSDKINVELKNQCIDLVTNEKTFVNSDEHMLLPIWKSSDPYDFLSSNKMSLNKFISKDSFINGKKVLGASKSSFQVDDCFPASKSVIASESSLDTTSDSPGTFEDSSSSIEEIFCPSINNPTEIKTQYNAGLKAQNVLGNVTSQCTSGNPANLNSAQEKINLCIPNQSLKESGEVGQKKDRVMPELIPTLICLDDEDEEDSIPNYEEKSPAVVSVADSPEMPKLIPFSAEADELLRSKAEHLEEKRSLSSLNKNTPHSLKINTQKGIPSLNDLKNTSVNLKTCTRKLFPDAEDVNVEHFKAKYTEYLSPPVKEQDKEIGFSFSASYKSSKQQLQNLSCGIDLSVKKTKRWQDKSIVKSNSRNEAFDSRQANLKDDKKMYKSFDSDSQISVTDVAQQTNKVTRKKARRLSFEEKADSADNSINSIRQPKILLRRISLDQCSSLHGTGNLLSAEKITFEHCLPSNDSDDNNSLTSRPECDDNSSNEAPEIEEIEGIRFFQFRSKRDMEEFNRKPMVGEIDMEMIVPTKTTDITQIKGWRNKYFATDSQLHYFQSDDGNSRDESSQNAKSVPMLADSTETKCLDFRNCLNDNNANILRLKVPMDTKFVAHKSEELKSEMTKETLKDEKPTSAMSAFVSKKLDDFLLNSATLNVSLLQTVNPNIIPIPPDASILGLGKLSQPNYELNTLAALKRRNFLNKLKEEKKPPVPAIYSDSDDDAVIVLSSSDESTTDDDVPVARLNNRRKRIATSRLDNVPPISSVKRRRSDASLDASQRVVLRLTKESRGASDGYKVSDISCEKENSEESSSSSFSPSSSSTDSSESEELPDEFKKAADQSSSVIKDTIFLKESEPKLLEEFLNNLNVLGTNNDVTMLVQSNQSYFVKGPVLQPEMCSEALDALLTNEEFVNSKNKHTPKKKLKAWQKYLPKKLTKIQQQKITTVPRVSEEQASVEKKPSEASEKSANLKNEKVTTSKGDIKHKKQNVITEISKNAKPEPEENIIDVKYPPPVSKEVPKVRKRRSRSAIELSDSFSFVERGKRSIRLPARYLDSAVLAAGSEWVSPIFVEDDKKSRKQLLDVLDKITPAKEIVNSEENKKDISKKDEPSSSDQQLTKKISNDNNQSSKVTKRQMKTSSTAKKMKIDDVKDCIVIKEGSNCKIQNSSTAKNLLENCPYSLPSCSCSPCSRTMSYQKSTKEFLCFSHNQVPCEESNSGTKIEKEKSQESNLKELALTDIKLISSVELKSAIESEIQNNTLSTKSEGPQSEIQNKLKEESERIESNNALPIVQNNPLMAKANTTNLLSSKEINVAQDASTKLVFVLPVNSSKALQLAPELKSKPPILSRKLSETPLSESVKSPTIPSLVPASARIPRHSPVVSSTRNTFPNLFKLPTVTENRKPRPLLPKLPQLNSFSQVPNNSATVPNNLTLPSLQSPSSQVDTLSAKGYKIGGVYVYSPGNDKNSSPMIAYVTNKSANNLPVIPDSTNNSEVQEKHSSSPVEADAASLSTLPKVPLDLHNYNKKLSERRRKSPLSERVFKDCSDEGVHDPDVDVDTVDEKFDARFILKKQLLIFNVSDASDCECDEIFSSNLQNLIYSGMRKSISARKRRLLIKKSFDSLKVTSPFFDSAKSCADILNMATFAVKKMKAKEIALRQAKRMLRIHNAQLLEKLASQINGIKEAGNKQLLKKHIITALANDWVKHRQKRALKEKKVRKVVKTSPKVDPGQVASVPKIGIESQTKVVTQQLDFEIEVSPKKETSVPPIEFEMVSKDIEQPHVQLRILELPSSETDKDIITLMDTEIEVKMEETLPTKDEEVSLPQQNPEKNVSVPALSFDGNNSDDDLLIIDLGENTTPKTSPQKDVSLDIKPLASPPPMREFPGLVPIFPPEFYKEDDPFAIDLSKFPTESKTFNEDGITVDAIGNSLNPPIESTCAVTPLKPMDCGNGATGESQHQEKSLEATVAMQQLSRLSTRGYQALDNSPNSMPPGLSLSPRNPVHRTCKDVKILHGVGNCPDVEFKDVSIRNVQELPPKVHEEIVIDDSDDEPMDLEQKQVLSTPSESSLQMRPPVTSAIDEITTEEDSRIKNSFS